MKSVRYAVAILCTTAALGLAACTQAPSDGMSGAAVDGGSTEVAPAVEPTVESLPMTEAAPPADDASAPGVEGEGPLVPEGFVAPDDPKAAARAAAAPGGSTDSDAAPGDSPDALSPGGSTAYVAAHNRWRANYGTPSLVWDDTVAAYAQEWADHLATTNTFEHRSNGRYGENMFWGFARLQDQANRVVDSWGSEVQYWDMSCRGDFNQCCQGGWQNCGHFTAVVWSTTTKVGCGEAYNASGNAIVVCNYDPAGNVRGGRPFPAPPTATPAPPTAAPGATAVPTAAPGGGGNDLYPQVYEESWDNLNRAIPDAGSAVTQILKVGQAGRILEANVYVSITHPYIGDLSVKLVHPDGTVVVLHDQTGGETHDIDQTFGRQGIPVPGLTGLNGKPMQGDWKLLVQDHAQADAGTLNRVVLTLRYRPQP